MTQDDTARLALLEAQVNASSDGILIVDEHGRKVLQNDRMTELFAVPSHIATDEDDGPQLRWVAGRMVDPVTFAARVAHLMAHPAETSRDELALTNGMVHSANLRTVYADAGQVEQVIMNIALNARDAMPQGGTLTFETANVAYDPATIGRPPELTPGSYAMLAITDSGRGMSAEVRTHIFEPFFSTKATGAGTGLGLSTCYGIIKQSRGHLAVYSEPGRGTTFRIYLPELAAATRPADAAPLAATALPHGTETVLLVEDDAALREMATTLLGRLGYRVLAAANGLDALSLQQQPGRDARPSGMPPVTSRASPTRPPFTGDTVSSVVEIPKPSAERGQTDDSLREERDKTDRAIAEGRDLVQESADEVLRRARLEADAVLEEARRNADQLLEQVAGTPAAKEAVTIARESEDAVVTADREVADQTLEFERIETARLVARLLPIERDQTDDRLQAERIRADGALANRDDFLGAVAHDLRDLLGGIVMSTSVIADLCRGSDHATRIAAETTRIHRHTARANRLIGDLVDVASIDAGQLLVVKAPGDVQALIMEAADEFRPAAGVKGIELSVDGSGGALPADFDHDRLLQVLANLIVNAIKFSPRNSRVLLRAEGGGDHVRCSVTDTGPGIPGDQLDQVFGRFVQIDAHDQRGLGLGLYIARQIVDGHAGHIWAESTVGRGTSMMFTIPRRSA